MIRIPRENSADLIKVGEVSSFNPEKMTCRVVFSDEDGLVSYDLPILQRNTLANHDFCGVDIGEDVLCLFLGPGQEDGFIIGSFYAGEVKPPESSTEKRTVVFKDGTRFSYDRSTHVFTATIEGTEITFDRQSGTIMVPQSVTINCTNAVVNASEKTTINTPSTECTGNLTVQGLITGKGGMAISGGSGATVDGSLQTTGDVVAAGISLDTHTHTGVHGETSGPH